MQQAFAGMLSLVAVNCITIVNQIAYDVNLARLIYLLLYGLSNASVMGKSKIILIV